MKSWMAKNLPKIGVSTLKLYMRLANHKLEIEAAREQNPQLSISEARRLITKKKPVEEPEPKPDPGPDTELKALLEMVAQWPDAVWAQVLAQLPVEQFIRVMPKSYHEKLYVRTGGQMLKQLAADYPNKRAKNLGRKDLRLVHDASSSTH
jgi:hypothetical protein